MTSMSAQSGLRLFHRTSAMILALFLTVHIANHVVGLVGQAEHIAFMKMVRPYYRNIIIEPVLLATFTAQAATGIWQTVKGWKSRSGAVACAQAVSGLYIAVFLLIHITSVVVGRVILGLDTDFRFAAAGFHVPGWPWYFAPYYFFAVFAVFALFIHGGCALYWNLGAGTRPIGRIVLLVMIGSGAVLGIAIVASLAGLLHSVEISGAYLKLYQRP